LNEDIANLILAELQKLREENLELRQKVEELSRYPKPSLQSLSLLGYRQKEEQSNGEGLNSDLKSKVRDTVDLILQYSRRVGFT
jgi:hypothetical protein